MKASNHATDSANLAGKTLTSIFKLEASDPAHKWRIKGSGVRGLPTDCLLTQVVVDACSDLDISVDKYSMGSPANVDSYHLEATFLDGGLYASTARYWFSPRGAWITGRKAVLLIAFQLGLKTSQAWLKEQGLENITFDTLRSELAKS
jgi:hypothetical protein